MDKTKAREILQALGIEQDEAVMADLSETSPTVRAYLDGEITIAEAIFIEEYLRNGYNASKAAAAAKYRAANKRGYSAIGAGLLKKKHIKLIMAERVAALAMDADEVQARFREVADASLADFVSVGSVEHPIYGEMETVKPDLVNALREDKLHLLKELKFNQDGSITIKLRDQDKALTEIGRITGAYEKDNQLRLPPEILPLLGLSDGELEGRNTAYDNMEDWEEDASEGQAGEDRQPDSEESGSQ